MHVYLNILYGKKKKFHLVKWNPINLLHCIIVMICGLPHTSKKHIKLKFSLPTKLCWCTPLTKFQVDTTYYNLKVGKLEVCTCGRPVSQIRSILCTKLYT